MGGAGIDVDLVGVFGGAGGGVGIGTGVGVDLVGVFGGVGVTVAGKVDGQSQRKIFFQPSLS